MNNIGIRIIMNDMADPEQPTKKRQTLVFSQYSSVSTILRRIKKLLRLSRIYGYQTKVFNPLVIPFRRK